MADRPLLLFLQLSREIQIYKVFGLSLLMLLTALTEGIGIMMLVPMLSTMNGSTPNSFLLLSRFGLNGSVSGILCIFIVLITVRALLLYIQTILGLRLQNGVIDSLRASCFSALIGAEWRWLAQQRSSDHVSLLISNISRVGYALNQVLGILSTGLAAIICLAAAFILSWPIALMAVGGSSFFLFGFAGYRKRALKLGHDLGYAHREMHSYVQEGLAGVRLTKILRNEAAAHMRFGTVLTNLRNQIVRHTAIVGAGRVVTQVAGAILMATLVYCGLEIWHVPIIKLLPILVVFARLVPMLESIQQAWHNWLHAVPALAEIQSLRKEAIKQAEPTNTHESWELHDTIMLDSVSFSYENEARQILSDISFTMHARTTTAIIGPSGAGKSTIADIVMGLITPQSGKVIIDGHILAGAARKSWRHAIAYVQQDVFLFHDTIRANMLIADPNASDDDLARALKLASAEFALSLPDGLGSMVGDSGVRLSGGERQRIALARALLGKPQLLILDESTSSLDPENETAIRKAIAMLHGNITVLIIGHRLAMVEHADQIIRVEAGQLFKA